MIKTVLKFKEYIKIKVIQQEICSKTKKMLQNVDIKHYDLFLKMWKTEKLFRKNDTLREAELNI